MGLSQLRVWHRLSEEAGGGAAACAKRHSLLNSLTLSTPSMARTLLNAFSSA